MLESEKARLHFLSFGILEYLSQGKREDMTSQAYHPITLDM